MKSVMSLPSLDLDTETLQNKQEEFEYDDSFYYYVSSFIDRIILKFLKDNKKNEFRKRIMSTDL